MVPGTVRILRLLENSIIALLTGGMVIVVFYQVLVRYLPISSEQMAWTDEVARLFLVWMAFITMTVAQRENSHFSVDIISNKLPRRARLFLAIFIFILSCAFLVYIAFNSFILMQASMDDRSPILEIPLMLFNLAVFFSTCLMFIYTILHITRSIKDLSR